MPILLTCHCGQTLRVRDDQVGRSCKCPACRSVLRVPHPVAQFAEPPLEEPELVADETGVPPAPAIPATPLEQLKAAVKQRHDELRSPPQSVHPGGGVIHPAHPSAASGRLVEPPRGMQPVRMAEEKIDRALDVPPPEPVARLERSWRAHVYWVLLLCCIPLVVSTIRGNGDLDNLLEKTLDKHGMKERFQEQGGREGMKALDDFLGTLPGHRLEGAFLARESWAHWGFALGAIGVFLALVAFAVPAEDADPKDLLLAGTFTATLGVGLLLMVQYFGMCLCVFGLWYRAALDPSAPFGPSLLGFVLGVGVCEEIVKCIPVLWRINRTQIGWREACLIGMASGAGFGISEGVMYSSTYYNGVVGLDLYFIRFISTVALHVMLSGACGIMIYRKQKHLDDWLDPYDWVLNMTAIMLGPIVLHGLFDTLLKIEMDAAAVGVWVASFALLAWLIANARRREERVKRVASAPPRFIRTEKGTRFVGER